MAVDEQREPTQSPSDEDTLVGTGDARVAEREVALERGATVGRYVVLERIGSGAMGVVYKAFDPELDRAVAIKLLIGDGSRGGSLGRSRLQREAQAMARISHPNVISVHDVGTVGERVFFAMELVDGQPLGQWLAIAQRSSDEIVEVFRKAGAGIAAAHAVGVIHRDFKPENVLVDAGGEPRVLDFGLARRGGEALESDHDDTSPSRSSSLGLELTKTGAVMGTPAYMAPEQFAGEASDERTDQFAFCVALHEALTGRRPFGGDSFATLSAAVIRGERQGADGAGSLPAPVAAALDRGLQTRPEDRFSSMNDLLQALSPPDRKRTGAIVGTAVAVLAVTTATAYGLGKQNAEPTVAPPPCTDAGTAIDAVWTDARRQDLQTAFETSGAFNGTTMGPRVTAALDAHAQRWRDAAKRSCAMIEVDRTLNEELTFRSQQCLDDALSAFEDRIQALKDVDAAGVQDSLTAVEELPSAHNCVDVGILELQVSVPFDPELRAAVSEMSVELVKATEARKAGEPRSCLERIAAVDERVRAIAHGPLIARMLATRAQCELETLDPKAAAHSRELSFEAALASADDFTALKTASETAHIVATTTDDFDLADTWVRRAEALAKRHNLHRAEHIGGILNVRGILAARQGKSEDAILHFTQLADLTRDIPGEAQKHVAAVSNVGVAFANAGRLDDARDAFQTAANYAAEHWGPRHATAAVEQSKLAQILAMQGRFVEARDANIAAVEALRASAQTPPLSLAHALSSLGVTERQLGNLDAAKAHYLEAYEVRGTIDALDTRQAGPLLIGLGNVAQVAKDYEDAERWYRESLKLLDEGPDLERAQSLALLAQTLLEQGDHATARALTQEAEVLAVAAEPRTQFAVRGLVLYVIAGNHADFGNLPRALQLYARAEADTVAAGQEQRVSAKRVEYARALHESGDTDRARALLDAAQEQLEASPFPAEAVTEAKALRAQLDR